MADPLRHHRANRAASTRAERLAEFIAEGIGTVAFLAAALAGIVVWILVNGGVAFFSHAVTALEHGQSFDPAPWILLNLLFSFEAFFTGSLVVIAQKAQAKRDLAREEADARHREEIADAHARLIDANTELTERVHELAEQIHARVQ